MANRRITMQCTGAAKPGVFKWTITRRGPVIADVELSRLASLFWFRRYLGAESVLILSCLKCGAMTSLRLASQ